MKAYNLNKKEGYNMVAQTDVERIAVVETRCDANEKDVNAIFGVMHKLGKTVTDHMLTEEAQRHQLSKQIAQIRNLIIGAGIMLSALITFYEVFLK